MVGDRRGKAAAALRALASPVSVVSLVVLVLNDHVLKQAWPGLVTGKLSDFAGLVVAPLALAVPLALLGVRRPVTAAVLATGLGFAVVKTTGVGAETASALWSAVGWPSYLRRDPTDLLALPALLVPLRLHGLAQVRTSPRARVSASLGALLLPFVVLATAATSPCVDDAGNADVGVFEGRWGAGGGEGPVARRAVFDQQVMISKPGPGEVQLRLLTSTERERITDDGPQLDQVCDPARPSHCWRIADAELPAVEATTDGGRTWRVDVAISEQAVEGIEEEFGDSACKGGVDVDVNDLALLETDDGPLVMAAVAPGRLLLRETGGDWRRFRMPELLSIADPAPTPGEERQLRPVDPTPSFGTSEPPTPVPSPSPWPTCASPSWVTVTPDPRNGPPTAHAMCDVASGP